MLVCKYKCVHSSELKQICWEGWWPDKGLGDWDGSNILPVQGQIKNVAMCVDHVLRFFDFPQNSPAMQKLLCKEGLYHPELVIELWPPLFVHGHALDRSYLNWGLTSMLKLWDSKWCGKPPSHWNLHVQIWGFTWLGKRSSHWNLQTGVPKTDQLHDYKDRTQSGVVWTFPGLKISQYISLYTYKIYIYEKNIYIYFVLIYLSICLQNTPVACLFWIMFEF